MQERSATLQPFFTPNGVAIIGASRDPSKLSYGVIRNLLDPEHGYPGPIYPVNPKADEILGRRCYPDISTVPDPVELAVLIIPAAAVAAAIEACGKRGVKAAIVISGGFREVGAAGAEREQEMVAVARRYGMRVMGPNGIGVIDTHTPLNTTFVKGMPPKGSIAFLSQSGALCGGIIDWTIGRGIGFSRLLSVGNEADVNETDVMPLLAADETSRVITLYLEDVKGGPAFAGVLRDAARRKPVVVLKAGRTAGGQTATASHTGALAGAHTAFRAAAKQAGAIEVESIQALFDGALALAYQPLPTGNRIAIVTNAGGPAALAADTLEGAGLQLARTSPETQLALRRILPPDGQTAGPVDLLGGADELGYGQALAAVLADRACDGVLAILVPQVLVNPTAVVRAWGDAIATQQGQTKPVVACLMGKASLDEAFAVAHQLRIPPYTFPEEAVAAFGMLWRRRQIEVRSATPSTESPLTEAERVFLAKGRGTVQKALMLARSRGQTSIDADQAVRLLLAYGLATPRQALTTDPHDAVVVADSMGYPVALKLISPDVLHKTDSGGVMLDLQDGREVAAAFEKIVAATRAAHPDAYIRGVQVQQMVRGGQEVIIGVKRDATFGPLVMFGLGGVYVEALADVSFRLAPLTRNDAEDMIAEVKSAKVLTGLRGTRPADREALIDAIVRIGQFAADHEEIAELDVNPLLVLPTGVCAVDARIILG